MEIVRNRNFTFLVYESSIIQDVCQFITNELMGEYAYILHDKDLKEDSETEFKKAHFHFVIHFTNCRYAQSVEKQLKSKFSDKVCISPMDFVVKDLSSIMVYLTHIKETHKALYRYEDIVSNSQFLRNQYKLQEENDYCLEQNELAMIMDYIETFRKTNNVNPKVVLNFCRRNAFNKTYKKYYSQIKDMVKYVEKRNENNLYSFSNEYDKLQEQIIGLKDSKLELEKEVYRLKCKVSELNGNDLPF